MASHAESVKLRAVLPLTKTHLLPLLFLPVYGGRKGAAQDQAGPPDSLVPRGTAQPICIWGHFCLKCTEQGQQDVSAGKVRIAKSVNLS